MHRIVVPIARHLLSPHVCACVCVCACACACGAWNKKPGERLLIQWQRVLCVARSSKSARARERKFKVCGPNSGPGVQAQVHAMEHAGTGASSPLWQAKPLVGLVLLHGTNEHAI